MQAHLLSTEESHRSRFGVTPQGIWPAEGAVSTALLEVLATQKCRWAASGEGVLANSLRRAGNLTERAKYLYRPYRSARSSEECELFLSR